MIQQAVIDNSLLKLVADKGLHNATEEFWVLAAQIHVEFVAAELVVDLLLLLR